MTFQYDCLDDNIRQGVGVTEERITGTDPRGFGPTTRKALEGIGSQSQEYRDYAVELAHSEALIMLQARGLPNGEVYSPCNAGELHNFRQLGLVLRGESTFGMGIAKRGQVLGEKAEEIGHAVAKDLGFTLEEAESIERALYPSLYQSE